ncbi:MAG: hypothetical protein EZS28_016879, partial [Streblomastix strix]
MFGEQNDNDDSLSPVRQGNQSKATTPTFNQQQQQQQQGQKFGIPMSLGVGSAVKNNKGQVIGQNVGIKRTQPFLWVSHYPGHYSAFILLLEYNRPVNGSDRNKTAKANRMI